MSSKDERTSILALLEEDAKLFIEIIDRVRCSGTFFDPFSPVFSLGAKAFRAERLDPELRQLAFSVLRRLCGKTGHLPESYLLSRKFDLSGLPRASGGFADVRVGVLKGKSVAVKSMRIAEMDDKARIRKVGNQTMSPYQGSLTHNTALLQRGCHVEEFVTSQRPQSYRSP